MYPKLIENLVVDLMKLPSVGRRSAERMVFWLLSATKEDSIGLADSIVRLKEGLRFCRVCNNFSENEECSICQDSTRDSHTLCIVEDPKHLIAIERSGAYKGLYHVLLGAMSPTEGRGPEEINIGRLVRRIQACDIHEVVIATDADSDGEMTALFIKEQLQTVNVKVSRIGLGLPVGSSVEFADMSTLNMSLNSRRVFE